MGMPDERRQPTHTLVIEVPLCLTGAEPERFDPVQDAVRIVMALSRLAAAGLVCDEPRATLRDEDGGDFG